MTKLRWHSGFMQRQALVPELLRPRLCVFPPQKMHGGLVTAAPTRFRAKMRSNNAFSKCSRHSSGSRAHILLCVLAYYVEWHMRQLLAPILFDDDDKPQAQAARASIVAPAQRSASAKLKALTKQTGDGMKVHSFQTLIGDLATIAKNRIQPVDQNVAIFDMLTQPTAIQQRALDLLHVTLRPN